MSSVQLGNDDRLEAAKQFGCILGQRVDVADVRHGNPDALVVEAINGIENVAIGTAPPQDNRVGTGIALELEFGDAVCDIGNLHASRLNHVGMVNGIVAEYAQIVVLLQTSYHMFQPGSSGNGPVADAQGIAHERCPSGLEGLGDIIRLDDRVFTLLGDAPSRRAIGDKRIGEQDDGCHVFDGETCCLECHLEAVGGRCSSNHN